MSTACKSRLYRAQGDPRPVKPSAELVRIKTKTVSAGHDSKKQKSVFEQVVAGDYVLWRL